MISNRYVSLVFSALTAVALCLTALSVESCKPSEAEVPEIDTEAESTVIDEIIAVTGIKLDKTSLTVGIGETQAIVANVEPSEATNRKVNWVSNDPSIASVDDIGNVTGVATGSATIIATTAEGSFKATCSVKVTKTGLNVTGVSLSESEIVLNVGEGAKLWETVTPSTATNKKVDWSSDKPEVADVDDNGNVSAISEGEAIITVTTKDGGYKASCKVVVTKDIVPSYDKWLGRWKVPGKTEEDIWTVEPYVEGKSFKVSGISGVDPDLYAKGAFVAIVLYDPETKEMVFRIYENTGVSWTDVSRGTMNALLTGQYTNVAGKTYYNSAVGNTICRAKLSADCLTASLTPASIMSSGSPATFFNMRWYGRYINSSGSRSGVSWNGYLTPLPTTMTKVD